MPLSRRQQIEQHTRRLANLQNEVSEAEAELQIASDMEAIGVARENLTGLRQEGEDCQHAIAVLERQIEEAEREKAARNAEIWESTEKPEAEKELDELIEVCLRRLEGFRSAYENLQAAEQRGIAQWRKRGEPGKRAFLPRAQHDVYAFLSVDRRGRRSTLRSTQARAHEILGLTSQEQAARRSFQRASS